MNQEVSDDSLLRATISCLIDESNYLLRLTDQAQHCWIIKQVLQTGTKQVMVCDKQCDTTLMACVDNIESLFQAIATGLFADDQLQLRRPFQQAMNDRVM